jgi:hypothetical protein
VFDHIQAKVLQAISPLLGTTPIERIDEAGLNAFFKTVEDPRIARVCYLEIWGISPRLDALYAERVRRSADFLMVITRQLRPNLPQSDEELEIIASAVIGAMSQSARHWLLSNYKSSRRTMVSTNLLVMFGVSEALRPRKSKSR